VKEAAMTRFQQKVQAQTMQIIGQMIGDDRLVHEGKEEERQAEEQENESAENQPARAPQH
jgi:hypothetical protein